MIPRPPVGHLWHVALHCTDLERMERFYVDVMGFLIEWKPDPDNVYLTTGRDNLALHTRPAPPGGAADTRLAHIGLMVASADDVDAWAEYLGKHGVTIDTVPRTHRDGARSLYFRDPEGNSVQIIHHPPLAQYV